MCARYSLCFYEIIGFPPFQIVTITLSNLSLKCAGVWITNLDPVLQFYSSRLKFKPSIICFDQIFIFSLCAHARIINVKLTFVCWNFPKEVVNKYVMMIIRENDEN